MRKFFICICIFFSSNFINAQEYKFTPIVDIECSDVKSQGRTGTCWSFSTSSFIEAEIKRITGKNIDVSEMYTVRNTYPKKAWNYVMRQGKAQFSEGGLAHDVINSISDYGLVPENVFSGLSDNSNQHNHTEMVAVLKGMLDVYIKNPAKKLSPRWKEAINAVLDIYLGKNVTEFTYNGKKYTPKSFRDELGIKPNDYITITSFAHQPFYSNFILSIPDNFSNGSMYNVPLNEFEQTIINALEKGYTVELDTDVSEQTFSSKDGLAVVPLHNDKAAESLLSVRPEKVITQDYRQQEFENFTTTDDHLMHITGMVKDQNGTIYFKTKNSWGSEGNRVKFGGYVYMSSSFIRLKAISVTINKNALNKDLSNKLDL
ncbi:C1 family peptidase [Pseudofulvibacter geojedonensis]|uniref:Aminopeptidase n=1 Tax=Pseudofulvibacter geojedonensis TaxID=1123758 RepID=A0ABW3I2R7_9FLAO